MGGGPRTQPKRKAARKQLSKNVAVSDLTRRVGTHSPTGGLNQRVANLPPPRSKPTRPERMPNEGFANPKRVKPPPDFKHLRMARALDHVSVTQKEKTRKMLKEEEAVEFEQFGLMPEVLQGLRKDVLRGLETVQATPVQRIAIPALLKGAASASKDAWSEPQSAAAAKRLTRAKSFLIAAETGSGKTLAYLLPLVHLMKQDERADAARAAAEKKARAESVDKLWEVDPDEIDPYAEARPRPRAIILVPTAELVSQVGAIANKLKHEVRFRVALLSREQTPRVITSQLAGKPDLIVATPHILSSMAQATPEVLRDTAYIVADEADSLFDRSFADITHSIIVRAERLKQLVLVSATIPRALDSHLRKELPDILRVTTPNLHAIPRRVALSIVDATAEPYYGNKALACADTLYNIAREGSEPNLVKKIIVFVNTRDDVAPLAEYLRSKRLDAVALERDSPNRQLAGGGGGGGGGGGAGSKAPRMDPVLEYFTGDREPFVEGAGRERARILVTTDIASRGIDTKDVRNVVLFDVPFSTVDFVHRLGRAGRMGRRGKAVVLVDKNTNKAWVREVKMAMHMGKGLV